MDIQLTNLKEACENKFLYPFLVSERDENGRCQLARIKTQMHGFRISTDASMFSRFFCDEKEGGAAPGTDVYEIRVKNGSGEWQDWQAFVGEIHVVSPRISGRGQNAKEQLALHLRRFRDNFQTRYSGILWRSPFGDVTVVDDESHLIKKVNPFTLTVECQVDLSNNCIPLEEQFEDLKKFREKYYAV